MGHVKSVFLSLFLTACIVTVAWSVSQVVADGWRSAWLGNGIASSGLVIFVSAAYLRPRARTSPNLYWMFALGAIGTALALMQQRALGNASLIAALLGLLGNALYIFWYSRFDAPGEGLCEGAPLPALSFSENGKEVRSADLTARPALWIFYRGNWCPLCVAQVR